MLSPQNLYRILRNFEGEATCRVPRLIRFTLSSHQLQFHSKLVETAPWVGAGVAHRRSSWGRWTGCCNAGSGPSRSGPVPQPITGKPIPVACFSGQSCQFMPALPAFSPPCCCAARCLHRSCAGCGQVGGHGAFSDSAGAGGASGS